MFVMMFVTNLSMNSLRIIVIYTFGEFSVDYDIVDAFRATVQPSSATTKLNKPQNEVAELVCTITAFPSKIRTEN